MILGSLRLVHLYLPIVLCLSTGIVDTNFFVARKNVKNHPLFLAEKGVEVLKQGDVDFEKGLRMEGFLDLRCKRLGGERLDI
ncbi:hypothetical protein DESC_810096 [Desulfosarcina cetonica]|nr:hypothetical protein DESC_810096 [Desulfosarcina cetonica]